MSEQQVGKHKVVGIKYQILDQDGMVLEHSDLPVSYLHGGPNQMFPQVEDALEGCRVGDRVEVVLKPEEAFGQHDPSLTFTDDIENVPPQFRKVGMQVEMQNDRGETRMFVVSKIEDGKLTVDGNHPFAGKILTYVVTVDSIRDATPEELKKGVDPGLPAVH